MSTQRTTHPVARRAGRQLLGRGRRCEGCAVAGNEGSRDEAGAVIILTLIFLIVVGGIVGSLAAWATNDLNNTTNFASARSLQYAASSATNVAIQDMRYTPVSPTSAVLNASPPVPCWGSAANSELSTQEGTTSVNVAVWCSVEWNPSSANTRVLTVSACPAPPTNSPPANAAICAADPYLQAVVSFDDYPSGVSAPNPVQAPCQVGFCGTGMTINSWVWSPVVPSINASVLGLSQTSGSISGGTQITITGTGFVNDATTVNFVEESGGAPSSNNVVLSVTPLSKQPPIVLPGSTTTLSVVTPAVTTGSTYFVTVTTPGGTSAYAGSTDVFTYTPVASTVTLISPNQGSTGGNVAVTITGTGFYCGSGPTCSARVSFGSVPSPLVTVDSPTQITAEAPTVTSAGNYSVTVTTAAGISNPNSNNVFAYSVLTPNPG